ncbi:MAG: SH3 domain-containing protein [Gammaproteobacteria bacterium]|nr:SH3 domain-containing protein [Gammaproteobacteria bacterium]MBU1725148.1 SH3 domain-containing protein [Gammaproteobacteria bacterium]MBU2004209.1 SH3 domain-containing protein [Gammaproteobacteria bacterium]
MKNLLTVLCLAFSVISSNAVADWYKAVAEPNLVVRDAPDVSGNKLGNVPYGGKVNLIERVGGKESIGGRTGHWAKIQWKDRNGYVFDAFLESMGSTGSNTGGINSRNSAAAPQWFKSNAKPSLVVRSKPDVGASKLGNIPYDGKIKVLKVVSQRESIGGRTGRWVKVNWQNTTGYVFDAFLEPADSMRTGVNSKKDSADMDREVAMQLGLFSMVAEEEGFGFTHDVVTGKLGEGSSKEYTFQLRKDKEYRILTACDGNCSDMDGKLLDENGNTISRDFDADDLPMLEATPSWTGNFSLKLTMHTCSTEPCEYAVAIFGK